MRQQRQSSQPASPVQARREWRPALLVREPVRPAEPAPPSLARVSPVQGRRVWLQRRLALRAQGPARNWRQMIHLLPAMILWPPLRSRPWTEPELLRQRESCHSFWPDRLWAERKSPPPLLEQVPHWPAGVRPLGHEQQVPARITAPTLQLTADEVLGSFACLLIYQQMAYTLADNLRQASVKSCLRGTDTSLGKVFAE